MHDEIKEARRKLERYYARVGEDLIITSARDSQHIIGSFHPDGRAIDFKKGTGKKEDIILLVGADKFDVVEESGHFHLEYDPK